MKCSCGIIENSLSGIIEITSFKIGSLNLGNWQTGGIQVKSIINTDYKENNKVNRIKKFYIKNSKCSFKMYKTHIIKKVLKKLL